MTRDHVNFAHPHVVENAVGRVAEKAADAAATVQGHSANVITVNFAGKEAHSTTEAAAPTVESAAQPAVESASTAVAPSLTPDTPRNPAAKHKAADNRVSLNTASAEELAAIKGLSKKLATAIVAARPFKSVEALLEVKGMGPKLLQKLHPLFRL
ncbi:MAG: helix-hairpin-helix domain-containing protein [Burkholderiales bacterium]|nr:helix-hairpin-helix domain-containing protein [Burkholderiales bacterium]